MGFPWKTHGIISWNHHGKFIWAKTHEKLIDCANEFSMELQNK